MPLEELHSLVEELKERIESHGASLRASEALTRYALIDPLLRELGWDTADPTKVIPEYKSGNGRADYALLGSSGNPTMMVEAKSLGSSLRDSALTQGITYCIELGTKFFTLTDGNCWEVYETYRAVPIDEKRIIEFNMSSQTVADVCLQSLALWRPGLEMGSTVPGQTLLVQTAPNQVPEPNQEIVPPEPNLIDSYGQDWQRLSVLQPNSGDTPPAELKFPDETLVTVKFWKDMLVETVRWLVDSKQLSSSLCPIQRKKTNIVATSPEHPSGSPFRNEFQIDSLYIETHGNVFVLMQRIRALIEIVGLEPSQFMVRFD